MGNAVNFNLSRVKELVRLEKDADAIIEETGIKKAPLRTIVMYMNQRDGRFYMVRGLFD